MKTDFDLYETRRERCRDGKDRFFNPECLRALADEIEKALENKEIVRHPESDPDSDEYQGYDFAFDLRSTAGRIELERNRT